MTTKTAPTASFSLQTPHPLDRIPQICARKFQHERVAIVGVGGTGSYILELVAKTWVREIHLFDGDRFLQHNAFRSPGPFSRDDLEGGPIKSVFHAERYSRMRKALIAHDTCINESNVKELGAFDTVFVSMLTGCRRNEILTLQWEDVDLDAGELRLRDAKTGARSVALSPAARKVLATLPRLPDNSWVIAGPRPGRRLSSLNGRWLVVRARAGLEDVRIHDLRHSFASRALALGESLTMIGKLLATERCRPRPATPTLRGSR